MKRMVILISGRGSNMQALLQAPLPAEVSAVISNNPQARGLEIARASGHRHRRRRPPRPSGPRGFRPSARGADRPARSRSRGAGRLHAHPRAGVRAALRGPADQHPSLAAAGFHRHPYAPARARGRRAAARLHGALRHSRSSTTGRSSCRRRCPCCPTTTRTASPRACSSRSIASCRRRCAGFSKTGCSVQGNRVLPARCACQRHRVLRRRHEAYLARLLLAAPAALLLAWPAAAPRPRCRHAWRSSTTCSSARCPIGEGLDVLEHDGQRYRPSESKTTGLRRPSTGSTYARDRGRVTAAGPAARLLRRAAQRPAGAQRAVRLAAKEGDLIDGDNTQTVPLPANTWDITSFGYNFAFAKPRRRRWSCS